MKNKLIFKYVLYIFTVLALAALTPLVLFFTAGTRPPARPSEPEYWPTNGWQTSVPEEQGFNSSKLAQGLRSLQDTHQNIDSLLILRNGYVVLDAHFSPYDGTFPHDLASVTKSVTTTLIAIAAQQGYLDLAKPVLSYFPNRTIANLDERKARLTVRHLVEMRNGMESGCLEGDEPTLDAMRSQPDWVQAALDRPMASEPGTRNCYDSPGIHILSAILQETTGLTALDFARKNLFEPLGIHEALWDVDPQGYTRGWGDLHLLPEDAAKFGYLWLHRGNWDGKQIVPEAWVLDSVRMHSKFVKGELGYGYGWWVSWPDYLASGRGGQAIRVIASRNTIVVVTGNYYKYSEIEKFLFPALIGIKNARPASPQGEAALAAALAEIQADKDVTVAPSPELIRSISLRTYLCASNPIDLETAMLALDDPMEAALSARLNGSDQSWSIGLDGKFRQGPAGEAYRGYWTDPQTFQYDIFDIGVLHHQLHFDGGLLQVTLPELELTVTCQAQN